jgi:hypothetical protein
MPGDQRKSCQIAFFFVIWLPDAMEPRETSPTIL